MTERHDTWDPPQDTGAPDAVETDAAALSSAEDLDEDSLRSDPLEEGMDPAEYWTGATKYGMTPREAAEERDLDDRLAEEEPDIAPDRESPRSTDYERSLGISADIAGGSMAEEIRDPDQSE